MAVTDIVNHLARTCVVVATLAVVTAACGDAPAPVASGESSSEGAPGWAAPPVDASLPLFTADGTVLEDGSHGPQLCPPLVEPFMAIFPKPPPTCTGIEVVGWDWATIDGEQTNGGTTSGAYRVVGAWDGTRLTLTEAPVVANPATPAEPQLPDSSSPCPTPEGGWPPIDPVVTPLQSYLDVMDAAKADPDFAGLWQSSAYKPGTDPNNVQPTDFAYMVINVGTTGDVEALDRRLRAIYNGPICVSPAAHSYAELTAVQNQISGEPGVTSVGVDQRADVLLVHVTVSDQATVASYAQRFGDVVVVRGWLHPVT